MLEDDPFMRTMLATVIRSQDIEVVVAENPAQAADLSDDTWPTVAVLDLHLGDGPTGIDVAISLRKKDPTIGLVFLTSFDDPRLLDSKLPPLPDNVQYLTKSSMSTVENLFFSINQAAIGMPSRFQRGTASRLGNFTNVQLETLRLVAKGYSNLEIAKERFVTERSVEISISRMAKNLGLSSNATRNQRVHMAKVYFRALGRSPIDED